MVDVLAVLDRTQNAWYLEYFDSNSGDRLPEVQAVLAIDHESSVKSVLMSPTEQQSDIFTGDAGAVVSAEEPSSAAVSRPMPMPVEVGEPPRILETVAARAKLVELIRSAKHEVIISVPFINEDGIKDLMPVFLEAIQERGVQIAMLWGIAETRAREFRGEANRERSAVRALKALSQLRDDVLGVGFVVRWQGNDHTKWVMCDRNCMLHGSYNIMSYRPRPGEVGMQVRREEMSWFPSIRAQDAAERSSRLPNLEQVDRSVELSVHELATELDLEPGVVIDRCKKEGIPMVIDQMSTLSPKAVDIVRKWADPSANVRRWSDLLRLQSTPERIASLPSMVGEVTVVAQAQLFSSACRGAEMACVVAPDKSASFASAIDSLSDAFKSREDSGLIKKTGRPGWRWSAKSLDNHLKSSGQAVALSRAVFEQT
jgi:hypothetical protein